MHIESNTQTHTHIHDVKYDQVIQIFEFKYEKGECVCLCGHVCYYMSIQYEHLKLTIYNDCP